MLETVPLHYGGDYLLWKFAFRTAVNMSSVSMLVVMRLMQNLIDYHLTGGVRGFWAEAGSVHGSRVSEAVPVQLQ